MFFSATKVSVFPNTMANNIMSYRQMEIVLSSCALLDGYHVVSYETFFSDCDATVRVSNLIVDSETFSFFTQKAIRGNIVDVTWKTLTDVNNNLLLIPWFKD